MERHHKHPHVCTEPLSVTALTSNWLRDGARHTESTCCGRFGKGVGHHGVDEIGKSRKKRRGVSTEPQEPEEMTEGTRKKAREQPRET